MKKGFFRVSIAIGTALFIISTVSCKLDVPIREMSLAKTSITRAVEVRTEKYAPEELKNAKNLLLECHSEIIKEELDKAKSLAEKSSAEAVKAIDKSLPLLSADVYSESKKTFDEADLLYAAKYSPEAFSNADNLLKEASTLNEKKEFWDSYLKSTEGGKAAEKAKSDSLPHVAQVREDISATTASADELKAKGGDAHASAELASAKEKLALAKEKADASNLKEAVPLLDEAKTSLNNARETTLRGTSESKLTEAGNLLEQTKKSNLASSFQDDITKADGLVGDAKKHHEGKEYQNSIEKSTEAIALLTTLTQTMAGRETELRAEAETKLANAKQTLEERKKITRESFTEQIRKADDHVKAGTKLFEEKDYSGTIRESDSALAILSGIGSGIGTGEKGADISAKQPKYGEEPATYVVKYNPRDRDCLWKISQRTYGNPRLWPLIYVANKDKIRDPDLIFPGQVLTIPVIPERHRPMHDEKVQKKIEEGKKAEKEIKSEQPKESESAPQSGQK